MKKLLFNFFYRKLTQEAYHRSESSVFYGLKRSCQNLLPKELRHRVGKTIHDLTHVAIRATRKQVLILSRYYWPNANTEVAKYHGGISRQTRMRHHRVRPFK